MSHAALRRELGLSSAVFLGLGSMLGTGIFVGFALAAGITGPSVILAIPLAAFLAFCNALSSAQLAAAHPVSGGTYEYGYIYLTPALGFTAGWMFIAAKVASATAACLGVAAYFSQFFVNAGADPAFVNAVRSLAPPLAAAALTGLVLAGLRRSARVNAVVVSITIASLLAFVIAAMAAIFLTPASSPSRAIGNLTPFFAPRAGSAPARAFLEACALMFVAYTGFGRIATLGEEVHDPRRTIPRAIILTMLVCVTMYTAVSAAAVALVGPRVLAENINIGFGPLHAAAAITAAPAIPLLIALGACTAMLGVVLNLILGVSRVVLAMGRRGDLPAATARLNASRTSPTAAVVLVGGAITLAAALGGLKAAWSFSAFTVLVYYAITNAAALRLPTEHRLFPRAAAWLGLTGCLGLAFLVETRIWISGLALIAIGLAWHSLRARRAARPDRTAAM